MLDQSWPDFANIWSASAKIWLTSVSVGRDLPNDPKVSNIGRFCLRLGRISAPGVIARHLLGPPEQQVEPVEARADLESSSLAHSEAHKALGAFDGVV